MLCQCVSSCSALRAAVRLGMIDGASTPRRGMPAPRQPATPHKSGCTRCPPRIAIALRNPSCRCAPLLSPLMNASAASAPRRARPGEAWVPAAAARSTRSSVRLNLRSSLPLDLRPGTADPLPRSFRRDPHLVADLRTVPSNPFDVFSSARFVTGFDVPFLPCRVREMTRGPYFASARRSHPSAVGQ